LDLFCERNTYTNLHKNHIEIRVKQKRLPEIGKPLIL